MTFRFENLRSNVVGRATDGLTLITRKLNATGQAEVAQLEGHGLGQEEVA